MKNHRLLATVVAAGLATAGCGGSPAPDGAASGPSSPSTPTVNPTDLPNQQAPPSRLTVDVDIKGGQVTPVDAQLQAAPREQIVIRVNSDATDQLHVHSTPEHTFTVEAKPNQRFQFTVDTPARVEVTLRDLNRTIATIAVR